MGRCMAVCACMRTQCDTPAKRAPHAITHTHTRVHARTAAVYLRSTISIRHTYMVYIVYAMSARTCRIVWYAVISFCARDVHAGRTRSTRDQPQTAWQCGERARMETGARTHTRTPAHLTHVALRTLSARDAMRAILDKPNVSITAI